MWKALQTSKIREIGKALPAAGYVSLMTKPTLWGSAEVRWQRDLAAASTLSTSLFPSLGC